MAYEDLGKCISMPVAADSSALQFHFMKASTDSPSKLAVCGDGERGLGILQNNPDAADKIGNAMIGAGISKVVYGGSITAGDDLACDANGHAVTATGSDAVLAIALVTGTSGDIHPCILLPKTAEGYQQSFFVYRTTLASLASADLITAMTPGFAGRILKMYAITKVVTTDADAEAAINLEIGTTDLTGGVLTIGDTADGDAAPDAVGKVIEATAITAANTFTATDTISMECVVTDAHSDGEVDIVIVFG